MLDRAARYGNFARSVSTAGAIDQHVSCWRCVWAHVAFQIAASHVDIAHVAGPGNDSTSRVVANVAAGDVGLVKINIVVVDADTTVLVDMTIGDYDVTIVSNQMNPVKHVADMDACDCQLHRAHGFDANAFGMAPLDGNSIDRWHALSLPNFGFEAGRIGGLEVGSDELESRP